MIIDIVIILFSISALYRGRDIGCVRQLFSTVGFFGGLFLGAAIEPHTVQLAHVAQSRALVTLLTTLGTALIGLLLGEFLGLRLKHKLAMIKLANAYDNALGALLGILTLLFSIWLTASVVSALPYPRLQSSLHQSIIISRLNRLLPNAPTVIADIGHLIDPNGFPQVFIGSEPTPRSNVTLPALGELLPAVNRDKDSVVKVAGQGCGGIVEGSGFVVEPGLVATNAHVVAGIKHPYVQDSNGSHNTTIVWFDPKLDFAVLRVSNLAGSPLSIQAGLSASGTAAAVLGYPGGGDFQAGTAAIMDSFTASGRNIYGNGTTDRQVYEIRATVIPGNSGGPLIAQDGSVIGVVFAESTSYNHVGYALTTPAVIRAVQQASHQQNPVSSGICAE